MFRRKLSIRSAALFALASTCILGGCSKKIMITQYPPFIDPDSPSRRTIAVMPFESHVQNKYAGQAISDSLATMLAQSGTYKQVYNRSHLKAIMDEQDLQLALGSDNAAAAGAFRKRTDVDAILVGSVTDHSCTSRQETSQQPVYNTDRRGNTYVAGYRTQTITYFDATASATASLIRVSDGAVIYSSPYPAAGRKSANSMWSSKGGPACLQEATNQVIAQLFEQFAVVRKEVKVNPDKDFITASEMYDNKWTKADAFKADDTRMFVVLRMPRACDRNRFRIAIAREDKRQTYATQDVVWCGQDSGKKAPGKGFEFNPSEIVAKGGPGQYVAKLYSGTEPVLVRPFKILP